jgi:hypothetical protein
MLVDSHLAQEICASINKENGFPTGEFQNVEDCETNMLTSVRKEMALFIALQLAIQIHFTLVLLTHWKRSHLPQKDGGVPPQV